MEKFPIIEIAGTPKDLGFSHGKQLKERISRTIKFYQKLFKKDEKSVFDTVEEFIKPIMKFDRSIAEEIEAIAEGSDVKVEWIYALNSRTELLSRFSDECTAVYFPSASILGQNWDWAKDLEDLAVIMRITEEKTGNRILMMTEPGIVGKIGFNSFGLGVTLNLLKSNEQSYGVPIHILLRSVLQSNSISDALEKLEPVKLGKSSNIIIGTDQGKFLDIEFCGSRIFAFDDTTRNWVHTNHYLGDQINTDLSEFASSFERYNRSMILAEAVEGKTVEEMKLILLDTNNQSLPICRNYVPDEYIDNVGTVTTIIMDLPKRTMHISKGSPLSSPFICVEL